MRAPTKSGPLIPGLRRPAAKNQEESGLAPMHRHRPDPSAMLGALTKGGLVLAGALAVFLVSQLWASGPRTVWSTSLAHDSVTMTAAQHHLILLGTRDGKLHALDSDTGTPRWRFDIEESVAPVSIHVVRGAVYFSVWNKAVYSLELKTGKLRWRYLTHGSCSDLAFTRDDVLVGRGWRLIALDMLSGKESWSYELDRKMSIEAVTYDDDIVYLGYSKARAKSLLVGGRDVTRGGLLAVHTVNPRTKWKIDLECAIRHAPLLYGRLVFASGTSGLVGKAFAIDRRSGKLRWDKVGPSTEPALDGSRLLFGEHRYGFVDEGWFLALNPATGQEVWKRPYLEPEIRGPRIDDTAVYYTSPQKLYALNSRDGKSLWARRVEVGLTGALAFGGGLVFYATKDGGVHAIEAE